MVNRLCSSLQLTPPLPCYHWEQAFLTASHVYPDSQNSQQLAGCQVMNQVVLSLRLSLEQIVKLVSGLMEMQAIRDNNKFELV